SIPQFYMSQHYSTDWLVASGQAGERRHFSAGYLLAGSSTQPQLLSHSISGNGSAATPYVIETVLGLPGSGLELTQQFFYVNGERTLRKRWTLRNLTDDSIWDLNLFHGGDATLGGEDN